MLDTAQIRLMLRNCMTYNPEIWTDPATGITERYHVREMARIMSIEFETELEKLRTS